MWCPPMAYLMIWGRIFFYHKVKKYGCSKMRERGTCTPFAHFEHPYFSTIFVRVPCDAGREKESSRPLRGAMYLKGRVHHSFYFWYVVSPTRCWILTVGLNLLAMERFLQGTISIPIRFNIDDLENRATSGTWVIGAFRGFSSNF